MAWVPTVTLFGGHMAQSDGSFVFSVKCQGTGLGERYF